MINCEAQAVYVVANNFFNPNQGIYALEEDLSWREVITFSFDRPINDLAIDDQGTFYGISSNGRVCVIDTLTGEVSVLADLSSFNYVSLVFNADGLLYTLSVNGDLTTIDPLSGETSFLLSLDSARPHDLTYLQGRLVYQGTDRSSIDAYNMVTGDQRPVFCDLPTDTTVWGLSNQFSDCNSNRIFAFDFQNRVFLYDFEEDNAVEVETDLTVLQGLTFKGSATDTEYLASVCPMGLEVNYCDSLDLGEHSNERLSFHPNPAVEYIEVDGWPKGASSLPIDIYDLQGRLQMSTMISQGDRIELSLPSGAYIVTGRSAHGQRFSNKLLVIN